MASRAPSPTASSRLPVADMRTDSAPSGDSATARSHSSSPSSPSATSASAPIGAEQPPSRVASTARSASTVARVARVVEGGQRGDEVVVGAALDRERALAGRGQHLQRVEHLGDLLEPADPGQPGAGEQHRVVLAGADLADPGVDVATDARHVQTEAEGVQLRDPARRAGADPAAGRELAEGEPVAGDDDVARVLARRYGGERDPVGGGGRQVLERVHGDVDLAAQQRVAQGADEDAGAGRRRSASGVPAAWLRSPSVVTSTSSASRPSRSRTSVGDQAGLGGGEQGGAGADADRRSGFRVVSASERLGIDRTGDRVDGLRVEREQLGQRGGVGDRAGPRWRAP